MMRRLAALALLAVAACTHEPPPRAARMAPLTDLYELGHERYDRACAPCHGIDARGRGPVAGELLHAPTDLTTLSASNHGVFPREEFIAAITGDRTVPAHGTREMPVWATRFRPTGSGATAAASFYAQRRLEALATYVESLQRPTP